MGLYRQQGRFREEKTADGHEEMMSCLGSPLLKAVWARTALRSVFPQSHLQHRGQDACGEGLNGHWLLTHVPNGTLNIGITLSGPAWSFPAEKLDLGLLDSQRRA